MAQHWAGAPAAKAPTSPPAANASTRRAGDLLPRSKVERDDDGNAPGVIEKIDLEAILALAERTWSLMSQVKAASLL